MNSAQTIAFLEEKQRLVVKLAPGAAENLRRMHGHIFESLRQEFKPVAVREVDSVLNIGIRGFGGRKGVASIESELKKKFGFGKLGDSPEDIARRVVKRGKIRDEDEGRAIHDLIADGAQCDELDPKFMAKLHTIFAGYEKAEAGKRRAAG